MLQHSLGDKTLLRARLNLHHKSLQTQPPQVYLTSGLWVWPEAQGGTDLPSGRSHVLDESDQVSWGAALQVHTQWHDPPASPRGCSGKAQWWERPSWAVAAQELQDHSAALECLTCVLISSQGPGAFGGCNHEAWQFSECYVCVKAKIV